MQTHQRREEAEKPPGGQSKTIDRAAHVSAIWQHLRQLVAAHWTRSAKQPFLISPRFYDVGEMTE